MPRLRSACIWPPAPCFRSSVSASESSRFGPASRKDAKLRKVGNPNLGRGGGAAKIAWIVVGVLFGTGCLVAALFPEGSTRSSGESPHKAPKPTVLRSLLILPLSLSFALLSATTWFLLETAMAFQKDIFGASNLIPKPKAQAEGLDWGVA